MKMDRKNYKELMIIGNGFDLNHGLKTRYQDFVKCYKSNEILNKFRLISGNYMETWYDFENAIQNIMREEWDKILQKIEVQIYNEKTMYDDNLKLMELNNLFNDIRKLFSMYISKINIESDIEFNPVLLKVFTNKSFAITFNYTSFIEKYVESVYYVHGSIERDEEIILGMSNDEISDICSPVARYFCKNNRREYLSFKRFLDKKKMSNQDKKSWLNRFNKQIQSLDSGKGGYDLTESDLKKEVFLNPIVEYGIKNNFSSYIASVDFSFLENISKLYIIGHSLMCDKSYLEMIFKKLVGLREIFVLIYKGEDDNDIIRKIDYLQSYFKEIKIETILY